MSGFFSVRLAPGVRVSASARGLRAHLGPRTARLHVGGGRTGVSAGAGPFGFYESLGGAGRRTTPAADATGPSAARVARAEQARQAELISEALGAVGNLHRQSFPAATPPVAPAQQLPAFGALLEEARRAELAGVHRWRVAERAAAKQRARRKAEERAGALRDAAEERRRAVQRRLDEHWQALLANDPAVVLATLAEAFEDNEAPVAPVGLDGDEIALVLLVPPPDVLPDRYPTTTSAGSLSLRRTTASLAAGWYRQLVAGHALVSAKEAFAVCPGLRSARVVVLRDYGGAVYAGPRARPLLATRLTRDRLEAVRWETATAWDVVEEAGLDTRVKERGTSRELQPLDLEHEPDLARLAAVVDLEELAEDDGR